MTNKTSSLSTVEENMQWFSDSNNSIRNQTITFQLRVVYPKNKLKDHPEGFTVYSEANLTFSKACEIITHPEYNAEEILKMELAGIQSGSVKEVRREIFKAHFRAALWAISHYVLAVHDNKTIPDFVKDAVIRHTAGITTGRFKDDCSYESLKPGVKDQEYDKYLDELIEEVAKLYPDKIRWDCKSFPYPYEGYTVREATSYQRMMILSWIMRLLGIFLRIKKNRKPGLKEMSGYLSSISESETGPNPFNIGGNLINFAEALISAASRKEYVVFGQLTGNHPSNAGKTLGLHSEGEKGENCVIIAVHEEAFNSRIELEDVLIHEFLHEYPVYSNEYEDTDYFKGIYTGVQMSDFMRDKPEPGYEYWDFGVTPERNVGSFSGVGLFKKISFKRIERILKREQKKGKGIIPPEFMSWIKAYVRLELSILATDGNLDPKEWELLKGYATTLGMQTEYNEYYIKAVETKAVKAIQEGLTLSTDEKAIIQKRVNIQELISSQVKLMVDNTFFADKTWTTLWPDEWKAKWDNVKQLASDFGAVDAFNAGLTSVMPSILSCLDAESIIQKWQVVKEFSEIGNADTQAALKQGVEGWLRNQVPKPEKITKETVENSRTNPAFRLPGAYEKYFAIAAEFELDSSFICEALSKFVKLLKGKIKECEDWNTKNPNQKIIIEDAKKSLALDLFEPLLRKNCPQ